MYLIYIRCEVGNILIKLYNMYRAAREGSPLCCISSNYEIVCFCYSKITQPKCNTFAVQQKCLGKLLSYKCLGVIMTILYFIIL